MRNVFWAMLFCALAMVSCSEPVRTQIDGKALGTSFRVVIISDKEVDITHQLDSLFSQMEQSMSIFDPNSQLSLINANRSDSVDKFIARCIEEAHKISSQSDGIFDITVKPLIKAYGFAGGEPLVNPNVDSLMKFVGYSKIEVRSGRLIKQDPRVEIDLNSIAKGFTVDHVAEFLSKSGYTDFLVEVGGEIYAKGKNAKGERWKVTIDRPYEGNFSPGESIIKTIGLSERALATSGNYRRFYTDPNGQKIVHTVNPKTGLPEINNMLSVTVLAPNATLADGYATMFMAMGYERGRAFLANHPQLGLDVLFVYQNRQGNLQVYASEGLED